MTVIQNDMQDKVREEREDIPEKRKQRKMEKRERRGGKDLLRERKERKTDAAEEITETVLTRKAEALVVCSKAKNNLCVHLPDGPFVVI